MAQFSIVLDTVVPFTTALSITEVKGVFAGIETVAELPLGEREYAVFGGVNDQLLTVPFFTE